MFNSQCLLSSKGPLGVICVAAYFFKKLKKSQVTDTDIPSSVDRILQEKFDAVTYRVLGYFLLGIVRVYSKKVEYLYDDSHRVLLEIKNFVVSSKAAAMIESQRAPYFSITLPESFELDAFDLEIIEDTFGGNTVSSEDITLKDDLRKTERAGQHLLDEFHFEPMVTSRDLNSTCFAQNEVASMDLDMGLGAQHNSTQSVENLQELENATFSQHEHEEHGTFSGTVEEALPQSSIKPASENHRSGGEQKNISKTVDLDEMHAEISMQSIWADDFCEKTLADLTLQRFGLLDEQPLNQAKPSGGHTKTCELETDDMTQPVNETSKCMARILDDKSQTNDGNHNLADMEAEIEKPRGNIFTQDQDSNMETFAPEKSPEHVSLVSDEEQLKSLETTPSLKRADQVAGTDHLLLAKLDTTPQKASVPDFLLLPTPDAKERSSIRRKRKCVYDDHIIIPNNVMKQYIDDPSDLVCKRKKVFHTAMAAWKAHTVSNFPRSFLEPLIPCALELRSLFHMNKRKTPAPMEKTVNVSKLPESHVFDRSGETVDPSPPEILAPECLNRVRFVEMPEPPEKLEVPGSPCCGEPSEPMSIAPETPTQHATSVRPFRSPDRPEIFPPVDVMRLETQCVDKQLSSTGNLEFDLNLMNEEINLCGEDDYNQDNCNDWSERSRNVVRCLERSFLLHKEPNKEEATVNLSLLAGRRSKAEAARLFYEILVLKSKGCVEVKQENAYGDILIRKASRWEVIDV